jgi:hypothetical protein
MHATAFFASVDQFPGSLATVSPKRKNAGHSGPAREFPSFDAPKMRRQTRSVNDTIFRMTPPDWF